MAYFPIKNEKNQDIFTYIVLDVQEVSQEVRRSSMREVGKDKIRVDAYGKVTGEAKYTADLEPKNILHGKV